MKELVTGSKHPGLIVMEAFDSREFDLAKEHMHGSIQIEEMPIKEVFQGKEGILKEFDRWLKGCPDAKNNIYNVLQNDDTVFMEGVWRGKHTGDLVFPDEVFQPTGLLIEFDFVTVATSKDGKFYRGRHYYDYLTVIQQLRG